MRLLITLLLFSTQAFAEVDWKLTEQVQFRVSGDLVVIRVAPSSAVNLMMGEWCMVADLKNVKKIPQTWITLDEYLQKNGTTQSQEIVALCKTQPQWAVAPVSSGTRPVYKVGMVNGKLKLYGIKLGNVPVGFLCGDIIEPSRSLNLEYRMVTYKTLTGAALCKLTETKIAP